MMVSPNGAIGIFDSGVGGLSVLRAVRAALPAEDLIYLADQAHVPYGMRPQAEVQAFTRAITRWLLAQGAKLIVVACNTASAAALYHLRETFPDVGFVGMEPAVKPAAAQSKTGVVAVLATAGTLNGALYHQTRARHANGVRVIELAAHGLVAAVENDRLADVAVATQLAQELGPVVAAGADLLVLGCTHFPFAAGLILSVVGAGVTLIDPAPAVARQVQRQLGERGLEKGGGAGQVRYVTTGNVDRFCGQVAALTGERRERCEGLELD